MKSRSDRKAITCVDYMSMVKSQCSYWMQVNSRKVMPLSAVIQVLR